MCVCFWFHMMLLNLCCFSKVWHVFHQLFSWLRLAKVLDISKAKLKIGPLIYAVPYSYKNSCSTHTGRRHIFSPVQLNTSCFDFAPTSQKQRGLNDEAEIKQGRKAWSTRSTSGALSVLSLPWPLKSPGCCKDVQRGELTFGKSCWLRLLPLCCCPEQRLVLFMLWESTENWGNGVAEALWGLLPQRYHFPSRERGSMSLCAHSHGPILSAWSLRIQGKLGPFPSWPLTLAWSAASWASLKLPGSLMSPKWACACLSLLAEVLTLSLLLNFYGHVMNNWIISSWFGKHASPLTAVPGSQGHQDMCPWTLSYSQPYCLALPGLKFANHPSTNNCFCQASYALRSLPLPLSFWWVLGISSPPGLLISSQHSQWQTPHVSYWHQILSKTSSLKSHCSLCSEQGLFRLLQH